MRVFWQLFSVVFLFMIFSCKKEIESPPPLKIRYLALGDSYTIGQGVEADERWPNQLSTALSFSNIEVEQTAIIAQTGWKTGDLLNALADTTLEKHDLVSLLIGVNNQFWGQPFETFRLEFDLLLTKAKDLSENGRVFVVSIPDYGVTPFGGSNSASIAEDIDMYNAYIEQQCTLENIPFVDVTKISRQLGDSSGALCSDNLHPSATQYAEWVTEMLPTVLDMLIE